MTDQVNFIYIVLTNYRFSLTPSDSNKEKLRPKKTLTQGKMEETDEDGSPFQTSRHAIMLCAQNKLKEQQWNWYYYYSVIHQLQ